MKAIHIQRLKEISVIQAVLLLWLLMQVGLIAYYNFALAKWNIDYDSAKLFVHALEICKHHNFVIDGWKYITTAEFDCSLLFAVPFYYLTGDIYVSFALSNMVFLALWIWTVFRLFAGRTYGKECALLALDLILIPYGLGLLEYFNMLFFNGGQYVVKALCPLMLITLLVGERGAKKWVSGVYAAICALLLLITTISSGIYVFVSALIPILGWMLYEELRDKAHVSKRVLFMSMAVAGIVILGYGINRYLKIDAQGSEMLLNAGSDGVFQNVTGCFLGIFGLFGAIADSPVRVLSYEGISVVMRNIFVLTLIGSAFRGVRRMLLNKAALIEKLLLVCFGWNTFILCICHTVNSRGECHYRYHLIGVLPLLCLMTMYLVDYCKKCAMRLRVVWIVLGLTVLGIIAFSANHKVFCWRWEYTDLEMLCAYVRQEKIEMVYIYGHEDFAEDCRLLDYKNTETVYMPVNDSGYTWVVDYYEEWDGRYIEFDHAVLVIDEATEDTVEMFGHTYHRIAQLGYLGVYQ